MSLWGTGIGAAVLVAMFVVGVLLMRRGREMEKYRARGNQKFAIWLITWAAVGLVWLFLAYERISFFGARFWVLVGLVLAVAWLIFIIRYWKKVVPGMEMLHRERAEFEKYLPRKKR